MKCFGRFLWLIILIISVFVGLVCASSESGRREQRLPKDKNGAEERAYESYVAVSTDLLKQYEPDYENFEGLEIADKIVYFQQRKIEEAIVQRDYILYHFDKQTQELLDVKIHWREDLPEKLPEIISKEQAEAIVEGQVQYSELFYICPNSAVFPIEPTPSNPCWVVQTLSNNRTEVVVIDAAKGKILGYGVPPPYTAFSCTGPMDEYPETCSCDGGWFPWYENARDWFNTMGYDAEGTIWPTKQKLKSHIQSDVTAVFYELAHGGSDIFGAGYDYNSCTMDWATAGDIETWIADYEKMPFTFIGSCDGMCDTMDDTLSYEFRKGSNENTVTVGYCGMSNSPCVDTCWYADYTIPWQNLLFYYINQNWTVKAAFDKANASYPGCGNYGCMRFAGDESFDLVPTVERVPSEIQVAINAASDGDTIIMPPGVCYGKVNFRGKNLTVRSTDPNNSAVVAATVIDGKNNSPVVIFSRGEDANCALAGFTITGGGNEGGISCEGYDSRPTIRNCVIAGNAGIGINCDQSSPTITNCIVAGNGDIGIKVRGRTATTVTNCTIAKNAADGVNAYMGVLTIVNSIIWANADSEIYGSAATTYTNVEGGYTGLGNIDKDPCFVLPGLWVDANDPNIIVEPNDPNAVWLEGDYHLQSTAGRWDPNSETWIIDANTSPCIDAGNPGCHPGGEPNGANNLRINMGAYGSTAEASMAPFNWAILADLTNDGIVSFVDLGHWTKDWLTSDSHLPGDLDRNGIVDMLDFALLAQDYFLETTWYE